MDDRDTTIQIQDDWIRQRSADLDVRAEEIEADRKSAVIDRTKAAEELIQAEEVKRKADEERVLLQHNLDAAEKRENIASTIMARNLVRERELKIAEGRLKHKEAEATKALAEAESERQLAQQDRSLARELLAELFQSLTRN